jgi:hypothetical protein
MKQPLGGMNPFFKKTRFLLTVLAWVLPYVVAAKPGPSDRIRKQSDFFATTYFIHDVKIGSLGELHSIIYASGDREAIGSVEAAQRDKVIGSVSLALGLSSIGVGALIALDDSNRDQGLPSALGGAGFGFIGLDLLMDWISGADAGGAVDRYNRSILDPSTRSFSFPYTLDDGFPAFVVKF